MRMRGGGVILHYVPLGPLVPLVPLVLRSTAKEIREEIREETKEKAREKARGRDRGLGEMAAVPLSPPSTTGEVGEAAAALGELTMTTTTNTTTVTVMVTVTVTVTVMMTIIDMTRVCERCPGLVTVAERVVQVSVDRAVRVAGRAVQVAGRKRGIAGG